MEERRNQEGAVDVCISLIMKFGRASVYKHILEKSMYSDRTETDIIKDISEKSLLNKEEMTKLHSAYRNWKWRHSCQALQKLSMKLRELGPDF